MVGHLQRDAASGDWKRVKEDSVFVQDHVTVPGNVVQPDHSVDMSSMGVTVGGEHEYVVVGSSPVCRMWVEGGCVYINVWGVD